MGDDEARELGLDAPSMTFYFEGGLRSLVAFQNRHLEPMHKNVFYVEKEESGVSVEVALQYVDDISSRLSAFANNIYNVEGGMHVTGFKTALTRTLNSHNGNGSARGGSSSGGKDEIKVRNARLLLVATAADVLKKGLELLGIEAPEKI